MKTKSNILLSLVSSALACSLLLAGCGPAGPAPSGGNGAKPAASKGPAQLFLLTGSTGGTYYALGGAIANSWNNHLKDKVKVTAQASGASVENMKRINAGEAQIGMSMNNIAEDAWNGKGVFKSKTTHVRAIGVVYPEVLQGVADANSNIKSIADLKGKTVAVGPTGSGSAVLAKDIFADLGLQFSEFKPEYIGFGDASNRMKDGHLDANFGVLAVPASAITDIVTARKVNIIEFSNDDVKKLQAKYAFISPFTIPAHTYGNDKAAQTISMQCALYCKDDVSEDVIYDLTKAFYENNKEIAAAHAAGKYIDLAKALDGISTPLHSGAVKYYKEKNIKIPDKIMPVK